MAPSRARGAADESKADSATAKERANHHPAAAPKSRKQGASSGAQTQAGKDAASIASNDTNHAAPQGGTQGTAPGGIAWNMEDTALLQAYRVAYHLDTPSAFDSSLTNAVLTTSTIGKASPTMALKKNRRKISKDYLATAVRKHFNSHAVNENDVLVNFLYKVKTQDQNFRMRFAPPKQK